MKRTNKLVAASLLGSLLLLILFVPSAQHAIDTVFSPLRVLIYPRASIDQQPDENNSSVASGSEDEMQIISYSPNVGRREVIVDIGDRDVSVGFAATVNDVLVGEVVDVSSKRARVLLINDPRFRVIADTARGAKGLINSNYRQIILIDIAQNQPIQPGDTVRTLSSQYPNVHDVAIGVVDEIMNSDDLLKQALLSQPVELDNLQRISIP